MFRKSGFDYATAKKLSGNCAEFVMDDGRRFAWSESNGWYELVEADGQAFTTLRQRLSAAEEKIAALTKIIHGFQRVTAVLGKGVGDICTPEWFFALWNDTEVDAQDAVGRPDG